ncbi:MAG: hypothetical protein K6G75_00410, partial [Lachnospiraceae bacterium]|nr:hypothetical protein [Lachnospiraceae bacterium]
TNALSRAATSQRQFGLNKEKASVFRRWPVSPPYRGEQTTRLTGGHDFFRCDNIKFFDFYNLVGN